MKCRHNKAYPIFSGERGVYWCPGCGQFRTIAANGVNSFGFTSAWVELMQPGEDYLAYLDRMKKKQSTWEKHYKKF